MVISDIEKSSETKCLTCTWDDDSDCEKCEAQGKLDCKWNKSLLLRFYKGALPAMLFGGIGFIIVGLLVSLIPLLIYIAFWVFFFGFFEIRVLCSHCPYYAEDSRRLHCFDKWGIPKTFAYTPRPLSRSEQIQFVFGSLILTGYLPMILFVWAQPGYGIITVLGVIIWLLLITTQICPHCVNFMCPLNRVPRTVQDKFYAKNPCIRK